MTVLNYSGLDIVGKASEVITLMVVAPFIVLAIMGVPKMDISNWANSKPLGEVDWLSYMNIMFWNLNSWDAISTLAGEVRNPSKLFPRALLLAVQLVRQAHVHASALRTLVPALYTQCCIAVSTSISVYTRAVAPCSVPS